MALISKIRNNMWLVIILLALGLGGFVFMDISSVKKFGGSERYNVGQVNGADINWIDFQEAQEALYTGSQVDVSSQRDFVWSYFVEDAILEQEADGLGLGVGTEEMNELQFGTHLSPVVQRNFSDPKTGQINRESLNSFRQAAEQGTLAPQYKRIWDFQQKEIVKDRLETKLTMLVKKGIYTPTWMIEDQQKDMATAVDFRCVQIPFDKVDDSEITVTDEDYAKYVKEHHALYERQMEVRDARYVVFDVFPTAEDTVDILEKFSKTIENFRNPLGGDSLYAFNHNGSWDIKYYKSSEMSEEVRENVANLPIDSIYGPFVENDNYTAVKVLDRQNVPDSVRARHILLRVQKQEEVQPALALADSLETVLKEDITKFDTLARSFSTDGSASKGGDLGFIGLNGFVKPMNDLLFYEKTEPGKVYRVITEFGIHLVEVMEKKADSVVVGTQLAYIREPIVPSETTQDQMYDDALEFAGQNRDLKTLKATVESRGDLVLEEAKNLPKAGHAFGTITSSNVSREIIRWLYDKETEVGDVAPSVYVVEDDKNYFNSQYIIVGLEAKYDKGLAKPASVMEMIEGPVKNKKRGEVLVKKITTTDLEALAQQFEVEVDTINGVNFGISAMKTIGDEPEVQVAALNGQIGETSKPIIGKNGVYVIQVLNKVDNTAPQNTVQLRRQATSQMASSADFELMDALKKNAKIKDNRYTFF